MLFAFKKFNYRSQGSAFLSDCLHEDIVLATIETPTSLKYIWSNLSHHKHIFVHQDSRIATSWGNYQLKVIEVRNKLIGDTFWMWCSAFRLAFFWILYIDIISFIKKLFVCKHFLFVLMATIWKCVLLYEPKDIPTRYFKYILIFKYGLQLIR